MIREANTTTSKNLDNLFVTAKSTKIGHALGSPGVFAHEVRPAYLELRQTGPETYDALWKVPALGDALRLGLCVKLPAGCMNVTAPRATMFDNASSERWTVTCAGGLTGGTIHIDGLTATTTDVLARLAPLDGTTQVARSYLVLGVKHILGGRPFAVRARSPDPGQKAGAASSRRSRRSPSRTV